MGKNKLQERIAKKNEERAWRRVDGDARRYFLGELRQARLAAQKDAEAFDQLLFVFERLGGFRLAEAGTLGSYKECLLDLAAGSALGASLAPHLAAWHSESGDLYRLVNDGRNDALHQGARARHLTEHTIELALLFEDALMNGDQPMAILGDIMVRSPATAEEWQPVSLIRQVMLTNSFSCLPFWWEGRWRIVTDAHVAAFLRNGAPGKAERSRRLGLSVAEAVSEGLRPAKAQVESPSAPISVSVSEPILVCIAESGPEGGAERLVGIVTAFDLL